MFIWDGSPKISAGVDAGVGAGEGVGAGVGAGEGVGAVEGGGRERSGLPNQLVSFFSLSNCRPLLVPPSILFLFFVCCFLFRLLLFFCFLVFFFFVFFFGFVFFMMTSLLSHLFHSFFLRCLLFFVSLLFSLLPPVHFPPSPFSQGR